MFPLLPIMSPPLSSLHIFGLPYPDSPWLVGRHTHSDFIFTYVVSFATRALPIYHARRAISFIWHPHYGGPLAAAETVAVACFAWYPDCDFPYGHSGSTARGIRACAA